jgi:glycosyltransferase involved in cell wall biosynthesis
MPPITALLHTANDALRLGRTLELLLPCSEIVIVDHASIDATRRIAREYGARVIDSNSKASNIVASNIVASNIHPAADHYLDLPRHDWILCLQPGESITENLQASLFEWSSLPRDAVAGSIAFSAFVREQTGDRWQELPTPETRLIPRTWTRWHQRLPAPEPSAVPLEGRFLRFALP